MQLGGALVRRVRGGGVTVGGRRARGARAARAAGAGATNLTTQFTCFTNTKVQVLTERVARALKKKSTS